MTGSTEPIRSLHGFKWFLVVLAIVSSLGLYALDNTIVANIVPVIIQDLGQAEQLAWLSVGFTAGGLCLLLPLGKIYSLFDPKYVYLTSAVLFFVGSALCGAAPSMNTMIVGRVVAGIGGNGLYMGSVTLLSLNTSSRERPVYLSLNGLIWGIGTVLGPILGGLFERVDAGGWRWAFYINLCAGAVITPIWIFLLPSASPSDKPSKRSRAARLDWLGTILILASMLPLVLAVDFGGRLFSWRSAASIVLFVLAAIFLALFALQQHFSFTTNERDRLFPMHFMTNRHAVLLAVLAAACDVFTFVPIYYIPLYFQFTRGDDALISGVRLLPYIALLSATMLANGAFMSKVGQYKAWYVVGSVLALIATVLLSRVTTDTPAQNVYGFEVLLGLGSGAFVQAGYAVLFSILEPADMAFGTSFMMLAQLCGITFGRAIASAIFVNDAVSSIMLVLPDLPSDQVQHAIEGAAGELFASLDEQSRIALSHALVISLRKTFIPCYAAAALCLVLSIVLPHKQMHATPPSDSEIARPEKDDGRVKQANILER
ncbi:MFS general substrate transporter [Dothidotthia symphoricarpi CBS 119687]|uniref:MFS general substrate transporter n=1 Tax=Dothidotthia symphoricarpi CBS 119687 TaxID=1392245 RepID=A0A6A6AD53_9PLEO|nr:MFS general substrate transporter [Dothidotthia symphoricarpi CBS 119687]KAF2129700.1 MFS general substrate transporter [Dothidotthia symphoricarpi CBS 119687]